MDNTNNEFKRFLQIADVDLIEAIKKVCRGCFPKTVEALDGLSELELKAVRCGGLLSLPKEKLKTIERAMKADKFKFATA